MEYYFLVGIPGLLLFCAYVYFWRFRPLLGGESKQKLSFVPDADNNPDTDYEITEPALVRYLLNKEAVEELDEAEAELPEMLNVLKDIDKASKITLFETHQSSIDMMKDFKQAFHAFVVFKTTSETEGDYWWSLEKGIDYITLQRSLNKENVKDKFYGEGRNKVKPIVDNLTGKGSIKDLLAILWTQQMIPEKYHIRKSNCQSLVTYVNKQMTEVGYDYNGFFKYSLPPKSNRNVMFDIIKVVSHLNSWHPLFSLIYMEGAVIIDELIESGKYQINTIYKGITPLQCAIRYSKTQMVKHFLKNLQADPTMRDDTGNDALQVAAIFTKETEIFDLLLAHDKVKIDDVNESGQTALHAAALASNVIAVKHLINKGAHPNIFDKRGLTPLHVAAAQETDNNEIFDLLLLAKSIKGMGNVNDPNELGVTALPSAACGSSKTTEGCRMRKGADQTYWGDFLNPTLRLQALLRGTKDFKIIDLLRLLQVLEKNNQEKLVTCTENNKQTLEGKIFAQLIRKGIAKEKGRERTPFRSEAVEEFDSETGVARRFAENRADPPSTNFTLKDGLGIARAKSSKEIDEMMKEGNFDIHDRYENGETPLCFAIRGNNANVVECLLEKGADPTTGDNNGNTPLQVAVALHKDLKILDLLVERGKVDLNDSNNTPGDTALHMAIKTSNVTAARFLLSKGANPNVANKKNGVTPLHLAAGYAKNMDIVELLANHKDLDVHALDVKGQNALHYAKKNKHGQSEIIINLLKEKYSFDGRLNLNRNSIRGIAKHFHQLLNSNLLKGDDEDECQDKFQTASEFHLYGEVKFSDVKEIRNLMEKGEDLSKATWGGGTNALHAASKYAPKPESLDVILATGKFDINSRDGNGVTPLHYAIRENKVEMARYLLEKGADPTIRDNDGITPLHVAAASITDSDFLRLLLDNEKVDINESSQSGMTALHFAMRTSNVTAARFLLSERANPNATTHENGYSPLQVAVFYARDAQDVDTIELLLSHKDVDVNYLDSNGGNALHYAKNNLHGHGQRIANLLKRNGVVETQVNNETEDIIAIMLSSAANLLGVEFITALMKMRAGISNATLRDSGKNEHGAVWTQLLDFILTSVKFDFNKNGNDGETPLPHAIEGSKMKINAWQLIQRGAHPSTPLHLAAFQAFEKADIDFALQMKQVDIDGRDRDGKTALHFAFSANNAAMARYLLEKGADPTTRDNDGITPFHLAAAFTEDSNILDLLLANEKRIDINESNNSGLTALHMAIKTSNATIARFLLSKRADPNATDKNGQTPLHLAAKYAKDMDIVELLLNHQDVDVNYLDNSGQSALHYARENEHGHSERIVTLLKEKGAKDEGINQGPENFAAPVLSAIKNSNAFKNIISDFITAFGDQMGFNELDVAEAKPKLEAFLETGKLNSNKLNKDGNTTLNHDGTNPTVNAPDATQMGTNPSKADKNGVTPLHLGDCIKEITEITGQILGLAQVDVDALDKDGNTAYIAGLTNTLNTTLALMPKLINTYNYWDSVGRGAQNLKQIIANQSKKSDVVTAKVDDQTKQIATRTVLKAIYDSDVEKIRALIKNGLDLSTEAWGESKKNALHVASYYAKTTDVIDFIVESGDFDINVLENDGLTPLHNAIMGLYPTINVVHLINMGADPSIANKDGITPLHLAVFFAKDVHLVELLLNHPDVDVNYLDDWGRNALDYAKDNKHGHGERIANLFKEKGAVQSEINKESGNIAALVPGHIKEDPDMKTIRFLIENGQDISALTWGENGTNALHVAAANEKTTDLIDAILETGKFDINGLDNDGHTPLHHAMDGSNRTVNVPYLIKKGADPNIANKTGITPLHLAAQKEETTELIDIILGTGQCNINPVDNDGRTPLHYAIKRPKPITINARRLIKIGANPGVADKNGVTPLHMAVRNAESMDLIEILLNTEAVDVKNVDKQGRTALDCARGNKHGLGQRIIDRLEEYGTEE
ncbi:uncharacterized protein LOC124340776 [Daphnia pulicaria]|uniref:uncharacterized protein LOC124340776 n=1 Tax=Daphnia pulicaria TaxID=35523 RepID=UPI001EEC3EED|nr:uncharacterized protein LOC124340776 [Daphnia pulicaria]